MLPTDELLLKKIIYTSFIVPSLLCISLVWLLLVFLRRRHKAELERKEAQLREQKLLIEKQEALQLERNRIADEMHDDLGGGLTSIKYLAHRAIRKMQSGKDKEVVLRIVDHSTELISNMSEIIWAMNAEKDDCQSLVDYVIPYARDFMKDYSLVFNVEVRGDVPSTELSGEFRRHIFLVIKESLHNIVKHSEASEASLLVSFDQDGLNVVIEDNGKGIGEDHKKGHGLSSMKKRMGKINGSIVFEGPPGTKIYLKAPVITKVSFDVDRSILP